MTGLKEYTPVIDVNLCGRHWRLERAADLESLWEAMGDEDFGDDERLPYWTELWPASLVLGQWLYAKQKDIAGKYCLDMGCGLGLTALVGSWLGAKVVAMDYEPQALRYAARNARINNVASPLWTVMDWRHPAVAPHAFDCVWGGDIMYERRFVEPVLAFLEHSLAPGGVAWVAEPNRNVYTYFLTLLERHGWKAHRLAMEKTSALYEQPAAVTVSLWELRR
ncbi:50S ribosomal protein L11 methyltransferase [Desulfovibrio mangrovi]|uniref:class I SAM-dependent methyltransferase n=1 Tax=Desulfovibrio mangrovi TaxID=2976983 RepID=UPI0022453C3B|nr:methyltransferase domain-containing protein [Desulfovibrio mangrovi]UZP69096.1 50S ribosomal protein L11 methyltransferase [Desulfovibrio mangrovi]